MNILMVAPESVPFVKVGGLADAVGALAQALSKKDMTFVLFFLNTMTLNILNRLNN